ncbi:Gfo/Idh/MocA family oxidoreductase [Haloferula sp.]|uniref:Gfo/Idh/MocA family oxidoreductase n=1 Tax=Haloferula sp. TaxID=2497595 RepID=UPI003C76885D
MIEKPLQPSRRDFLKKSAIFGTLSILPAHIALGQTSGGKQAPSQQVRLAVVGIGNQGGRDLKTMADSGHCTVVALCDVDLNGKHTREAQAAHPKAKKFQDFRVMFDKMADEIDAVLIATPDHSHFCVTMLAMSLGKHVYVEKPLAHTFGQCDRLMALAEKSGVVTQMGNQGHSGGNYFQYKAWVDAGVINNVTRITAYMNSPRRWHGWGSNVKEYPSQPIPKGMDWDTWICSAPEHPFSDKLHPQEWRSWYDYGSGAFGDWGPHILDTSHRFLNLGLPSSIEAVKRSGANPLVFPQESTIKFKFPARGDMPACDVTWLDGVKNMAKPEKELGELNVKKPGKLIYGKDLTFHGGSHSDVLQVVPREKFMEIRKDLPRISGKNSNHYENFLLACKGEEEARSPFSVGGPLTQVFTLGILAQRFGGTIDFDRETNKVTNNEMAQALLDPAPRKGWEEFYKL